MNMINKQSDCSTLLRVNIHTQSTTAFYQFVVEFDKK